MTRRSFTPRWIGLLASCVIAACGPMMTTDGGGSDAARDSGGGDARADSAPVDTGTDTGVVDTGPADTGPADTGPVDTGPVDMGTDVPVTDTGDDIQDVTAVDTGTMDAGDDAMDVPVTPDVPMTDVPVTPTCPYGIAGAITLPSTTAGMLMGANDVTGATCQMNANGPDDFYTLHIDTTTGVDLRTTGSLDTVLSIRTACDVASSEVACDDDHGPGFDSWIRTVLMPGDYIVVADQYNTGTGGAYGIDARAFTPASNSACAMPVVLTAGTPVTGDTDTGVDLPTRCLTDEGQQLYYSLTVPAGNRATVTVTPDAMFRAAVRVFNDCAATSCTVNATSTAAGMPATVTIDNRGTTDTTYRIAVGSNTIDTNGTFTINAMFSAYPTAANAMCSMATMIADGTMLTGQNIEAGVDSLTAACRASAAGRVLYYTATIPAASTLTVTATPSGAWNPVIRLLSACGATTCLSSNDASGSSAAESLRYTNGGSTPQTVIVAVGASSATAIGTFDLATSITPVPTNTNSTCSTATALTDGVTLMAQNADAGLDTLSTACVSGGTGRVVYYSVAIPANTQATVRVAPSATWDPVVRVLDTCTSTTCVTSADAGGNGGSETVSVTNNTASVRNIIVAVGSYDPMLTGTFDITLNQTSLAAPNAMCSMATALTSGTPVMQNSVSGVDVLSSACVSGGAGGSLYYTVNVPTASSVTVRVVPTGFDAVLRVLDACGATTCFASSDTGATGGTETWTFHNTGAARSFVLAVGSYSATTNGSFTITATVAADPYSATPIATAMCDDVTSGMVIAAVNADDTASAITMLPSAFTYFGTSYGYYSVTSNGFMQLWPSTTGSPSTAFTNLAIPDPTAPSNLIAPFWDDLTVPTAEVAEVRVLNVTTAPAHFTVQWTNWRAVGASSTRMTFQVQLYPATNTIEFHYCNLVPGTSPTRSQGDSATVGLQNATGTSALQYSFNTASLTTGTGIRFTPLP